MALTRLCQLRATALTERSCTRSKVRATPCGVGTQLGLDRDCKRAVTTTPRKLAAITHAIWRDGTDFRFAAAPAEQLATQETALEPA